MEEDEVMDIIDDNDIIAPMQKSLTKQDLSGKRPGWANAGSKSSVTTPSNEIENAKAPAINIKAPAQITDFNDTKDSVVI